MSIHTDRGRTASRRITAFGGIRRTERISDVGAVQMKNLRILPDGSLKRRCGYVTVLEADGRLRGYWEGGLAGKRYIFYVAARTVYRLSSTDTSPVALQTITASEAAVSFFKYREELYLADGHTLLVFRPSSGLFSTSQGYVPLYGKDWHPTQLGEVNEPRNLFCNSIRVHYVNSVASQTFRLPFTATRIQAVIVNGTRITNYTFTSPSSTVTIPSSYAVGGDVLIACDLDPVFSGREAVLKASHAAVYRDGYREAVFTYGGTSGYRLYRTAVVDGEMLAGSQDCYPSSDGVYFRAQDVFALGNDSHPITAAIQHLNRMLVFSDDTLWVLKYPLSTRDEVELVGCQPGLGCVATDGAVLCRGTPMVLSVSGVARIGLFGEDPDLRTLTVISEDIADRLTDEILRRCVLYWNERNGQLWLRDTEDTSGTVWLTDPDGKCWVRYTGIVANRLIDRSGKPGFTTASGGIAEFRDELNTDDGTIFEASYTSSYLDFGNPEAFKRSGSLSLCADSGGGRIYLTVETENAMRTFRLDGTARQPPECFERRFCVGRFRFLRYWITLTDSAPSRILSLTVNVCT